MATQQQQQQPKRILVYGGRGALGANCVSRLKSLGHWVCSVDLADNAEADANVAVSPSSASLADQAASVYADVAGVLGGGNARLDGVVCVAGGWAGGNAASADLAASCDLVLRQSVWTSVVAAGLAARHLDDGGLLVLTGAQPALGPTPGMLGYGMAKAAVHQMVASLAAPDSGLPAGSRVVAILPITLDTPANRRAMGESGIGNWTPLDFVSGLIADWLSGSANPESGSLLTLVTKDFNTQVVPV